MKVVAVIPAHNEIGTVAAVVTETRAHVDEVILVDDGSRDGTGEAAAAAGAIVHRLSPNQGKGAALNHGLRAALARDADVIVTLDADGEHCPDQIPDLVAHTAHYDLVVGSRRVFRSPTRRVLNHIALFWFRQIDPAIDDTICGFRAFRAAVVPLLYNDSKGFAYEHAVLLQAHTAGLPIGTVPVRIAEDGSESQVTPSEMARVANHFAGWVLPRLGRLDIPLRRKILLAAGCMAGYSATLPVLWAIDRRRP